MKVVINKCYGGFGLSHEAIMLYAKLKPLNLVAEPFNNKLVPYLYKLGEDHWSVSDIDRDDEVLVQVVEKLGENANTRHSDLRIVNIPDDVQWTIEEYDGTEWIAEAHRTWS